MSPAELEGGIALAAALAFTAGFADAVAYLAWHSFAANATGNTVLVGMALAQRNLTGVLGTLGPKPPDSVRLPRCAARAHRDRDGRPRYVARKICGSSSEHGFVTGDYGRLAVAVEKLIARTPDCTGRATVAFVTHAAPTT